MKHSFWVRVDIESESLNEHAREAAGLRLRRAFDAVGPELNHLGRGEVSFSDPLINFLDPSKVEVLFDIANRQYLIDSEDES